VTSRKPPGVGWESWVEQQIREARERGEFDDMPGHGQPLPDLDRPRDELWWVRKKLRREKVSYSPPAISLRRELDEAHERMAAATTEAQLRAVVAAINERIRYVNSHTVSGPPTTVAVLDVEEAVQRWRAQQHQRGTATGGESLDEA
jgi:DnaJ homologue, subfamily C, member 28, conserved domain